jgi:hypothetical protein
MAFTNVDDERRPSVRPGSFLIYCLGFSDTLKIDVSQAVRSKLEKNAKKYPARLGLVSSLE